MNLVDAYVTAILAAPEYKYLKWWVKVEADVYGSKQQTELMFGTLDEALALKVGFKFQC